MKKFNFNVGDLVKIGLPGDTDMRPFLPDDYLDLIGSVGLIVSRENNATLSPQDDLYWEVVCNGKIVLLFEEEMMPLKSFNAIHGLLEED